jgi:D-alanyl-D-alanine carboxypeptidase
MRVLVAVFMLVMTAASPAAAAQDLLGPTVRAFVDSGFPGAVGYARVPGREQFAAAGVADIRTGRPATPTDRFRIASNTKAFTATVVLQLVGQGQLTLDDPVRRWLPYMPEGVTVRQLLDPTKGLYDPTSERAFWAPYLDDDYNRGFVYRPRDLVATALTRPTVADYTNTGYLVLGLLIEKVTGHHAVGEIKDRIFIPLGLEDTSMPTIDPWLHGRYLHGYDLGARTDLTVFSPSYDWTAGAIVSTAQDLARFYEALFDGTLLAPAQLGEMTRDKLGIKAVDVSCPQGEVRVWGNDGGGPGYSSFALVSADASRRLVLVGNVFDILADVHHLPTSPFVDFRPAAKAVFC